MPYHPYRVVSGPRANWTLSKGLQSRALMCRSRFIFQVNRRMLSGSSEQILLDNA